MVGIYGSVGEFQMRGDGGGAGYSEILWTANIVEN